MMMLRNILRETVYMRFLLAFIIGILVYEILAGKISLVTISIVFTLSIIVFIYYLSIINRYNITFNFGTGLTVFTLCALFAFQLSYFQDTRNYSAYKEILNSNVAEIEIKNSGRKSNKYCSYEVELINQNISVPLILSIEDDSLRYSYGDILKIQTRIKAIDFINNPGQFDYKKYLSRKHIYHKIQIKKEEILRYTKNETIGIWEFSNRCRNTLLHILKKNIKDEGSYEMSAALLLGERADLDKNLLKSYSNTGTIHIISVSGLHVGIIFLVMQYLLSKLKFLKNEYSKGSIIIVGIWFYATLTGLPASVIRSACMISFHTIGKMRSSNVNSINHVAGSAIYLLSFNTNYLFDVGFQLSYLAVFGIMYLQKWINGMVYTNTKITNYIWSTTSISLAAQLFTLPLCIYYFKQFPNYFIVANLLAIPLSSIALYASIALLFFAKIPYLNTLCEWVLTYSIKFLNEYLMWISNWPYSLSLLPRIDVYQLLLWGFIIFFLMIYLKERIRIGLKLVLVTLIIYCSYSIIMKERHWHSHLWRTYYNHQVLYSIESDHEIIHFIPNKMKAKSINAVLSNWKNYTRKHQHIKIIPNKNYSLKLNNVVYMSDIKLNIILKEKFERICLK